MATISEEFSTGEVTLSTTTADAITLTAKNSHKILISNVSGSTSLHAILRSLTGAVAAQGTLTMDTVPVGAVAAQGTLTIAEPVTDGDTFTIDAKVYTLQDTLTEVDGNIWIGADEAATKLNIVAAVNADPDGAGLLVPGVNYALAMTKHPTVSISDFTADDAVLTADTAGSAGDAIVTTETFTHASNIFDDTTLGTVTTGTDADTLTIDTNVYTFTESMNASDAANTVEIGANLASAKVNLVAAINRSTTAGDADGKYSELTEPHPTVTAAAFAGDDMVITAKTTGTAANSLATTETFTAASNIFDDATLGTTTAGAARVATTATAAADRHVIPAGLTLELSSKAYGAVEDGLVMSLVGNGNTYVVQLVR